MTPKKSLGRGAFYQRKGPHGGEFQQKKKMSNAWGSAPGGGEVMMGTLGFDSYITSQLKSQTSHMTHILWNSIELCQSTDSLQTSRRENFVFHLQYITVYDHLIYSHYPTTYFVCIINM